MTSRKNSENQPDDLPPVPPDPGRIPIGLESYALMTWAREVRGAFHRRIARAAKAWILAQSRRAGIRFRRRSSDAASQAERDQVSTTASQH